MNKKPTHLKIVSDNSKQIEKEPETQVDEVIETRQLNFFGNHKHENKTEKAPAYNERELEYLLSIFEKALNQTLKNNAVRNTNDLNRLRKAVNVYNDKVVKSLYQRDNILSLILIIELIKRLDKVDYRIKKPPYEEDLSIIFLKDFAIKVYFSKPELIDQFIDYILSDEEFLNIGIDWLMSAALLIVDLPQSYTMTAPIEKLRELHSIHEYLLKRFLAEGFRRENEYKIDLLTRFINVYLKNCILFNIPLEYIEAIFAGHELDYCINTQFIEFLIGGMELRKAYHIVQNIAKKGQLKKFYDKLNIEENERFINALFNFLYHCLCMEQFDYFENSFFVFSKVARDNEMYEDLLLLYKSLAPVKRVKQFLKKIFSKDSNYTKSVQNKVRRILLEK